MKNLILLSFFLWYFVGAAFGQAVDGKVFNKKGYQAWVELMDSRVVHGLLWSVDFIEVQIKSDQVKGWKDPSSDASVLEIPIERVKSIRVKRVHAVWKGYGYGVLTGVAVGSVGAVVFELIQPDDGSILLIPMGGFIGSAIGIIAGNFPGKTFQIEGNEDLWKTFIPELEEKAFWGNKGKR